MVGYPEINDQKQILSTHIFVNQGIFFIISEKDNPLLLLPINNVFNTNFNNISVLSWCSVLLVEENGGPGENIRPVASH
jgi:hypothetical protein